MCRSLAEGGRVLMCMGYTGAFWIEGEGNMD